MTRKHGCEPADALIEARPYTTTYVVCVGQRDIYTAERFAHRRSCREEEFGLATPCISPFYASPK